jgi:hypothetical protein
MRFVLPFLTAAIALCVAGCTTPNYSNPPSSTDVVSGSGAVRTVDCRLAPEMMALAERARQVGNKYYPQVVDLIVAPGQDAPRQFDIVFKKMLIASSGGQARETIAYTKPAYKTIYLDASLWGAPTNYLGSTSDPAMLNAILIHEMTHVAQQYHTIKQPYWAEGMADYAFFKLGFTNGSFCAECSEQFPNYKSGYSCAGAFLLQLDSIYGPNLIRELNTQLRKNTYSDSFFAQYTGKSLQNLWADFQKTRAYTPVAARVDQLRQLMGYVDNRPPKDFAERFDMYVSRQPWGAELAAGLRASEDSGQPIRNAGSLMRMYVYFSEPGGSAYSYLLGLKDAGRLPGISKSDRSWANPSFMNEKPPTGYPVSQTLHFRKSSDPSQFNYTVVRQSPGSPWTLQRAWRIGMGGAPITDLPLATSDQLSQAN